MADGCNHKVFFENKLTSLQFSGFELLIIFALCFAKKGADMALQASQTR